jgi:hypothetical protein
MICALEFHLLLDGRVKPGQDENGVGLLQPNLSIGIIGI